MLLRQLTLKPGATVGAVNIEDKDEIPDALQALEIQHPKTVIVLVGGAGGMDLHDKLPTRDAIAVIAQLAEETQSVVIDGGTQAGVMLEVGNQRERNKYSFPLIGVVHAGLILRRDPDSILDPNHSHFIFIPGQQWGDESPWISKIATAIAEKEKSITVLVNGGDVSRFDIANSLLENRLAVIMRGTGRLADEIDLTESMVSVAVSQTPAEILSFLRSKLS